MRISIIPFSRSIYRKWHQAPDALKALLTLSSIVAIVFFPLIFGGKTLFFGDNYSLLVPGKLYTVQVLREGQFPHWNPYILSGQPFFSDISQSVLYPSTLLFILFSPAIALNMTVVSHLIISGLGAYMAARKLRVNFYPALLGGIIWMLSQSFIAGLYNLAVLQSVAWMPWMFFVAIGVVQGNRLYAHALIAFSALSVIGGHPQPTLFALAISYGYILFHPRQTLKQRLLRVFVPLFLTLAALAIVLVPFIQTAALSTRAQMGIDNALQDSLHPLHFIELLIPNFFSNPRAGYAWGIYWNQYPKSSLFITIIPLIIIALSIKKTVFKKSSQEFSHLWLFIIFITTILFSLGKYFPVTNYMFNILTPLHSLRNLSLILFPWFFAVSMLVAVYAEASIAWLKSNKKKLFAIFISAGTLFLIMRILLEASSQVLWNLTDRILSYRLSRSPFHTLERDVELAKQISLTTFMVFSIAAVQLFALTRKKVRWPLMLAATVAGLFWSARSFLMYAPLDVFEVKASPQVEWLQDNLSSNQRFLSLSGFLPYSGFPTYWQDVRVRPPFQDSRFTKEESITFRELKARKNNLTPDWNQVYELPTTDGFATLLLQNTAEYWKVDDHEFANINEVDRPSLKDSRFDQQGVKFLLLNKIVYPKPPKELAQFPVVYEQETWRVYENSDAGQIITSLNEEAAISDVAIQNNQMQFSYQAGQKTLINIAVANTPGWSCVTAGGNCSIQADVESLGMQIVLPQGAGKVLLRYQTPSFVLLSVISGVAALALVTSAIFVAREEQISHI